MNKILEDTDEFVAAVAAGADALIAAADELKNSNEFTFQNDVGIIIRRATERNYQYADILNGWLKRIS